MDQTIMHLIGNAVAMVRGDDTKPDHTGNHNMATSDHLIFLVDVDNTLLDNDRYADDLTAQLDHAFGAEERERYWSIYKHRFEVHGYADYLGALQTFREACEKEQALLKMSAFLLEYPFTKRIYPGALKALEHLRTIGRTALLSDGDIVFQPRKIQRSGLWDAVAGEVMICVHKERELEAIQRRFPAAHYVMIDDKPRLLSASKRVLGQHLTTVFIRQGHYANAYERTTDEPAPDLCIEHIADLCDFTEEDFRDAASHAASAGHDRTA
ncbi:HAD family hydrolase [Oleiagrimonas sp.]|uniref:HAD family hydrolase n=1 Tax=Oleiagrimonas sp. TaxID=2010330 RepID=UPI0026136112|nr:HAD family hydrolase [Oleiagrimonas sp.]MDA3913097.1 HAD family hydrolase [Oleiagrimonas sp.]